jgi:hypothetical protein
LAEVGVRVMEIPILPTDVFGETARLKRHLQPITAAACSFKGRSVEEIPKTDVAGIRRGKEKSRISKSFHVMNHGFRPYDECKWTVACQDIPRYSMKNIRAIS